MSALGINIGYIQQVAEVLAEVVKLDVTIVSSDLIRVAGTGHYKSILGEKVPAGSGFAYVKHTGKKISIFQPKVDPICRTCSLKLNCLEVANVTCPITSNQRLIGFISFTAFDEIQKEKLVTAERNYGDFITKMSELIGSKVAEEEINQELARANSHLRAILHSVHEGIIATDEYGKITTCNASAEKMFRIAKQDLLSKPISFIFPELCDDNWQPEIKVTDIRLKLNPAIGEQQYLCCLDPIRFNEKIIGMVLTFKDFKEIRKIVADISSSGGYGFEKIIFRSKSMEHLLAKAEKAAKTKSTVLIRGESGTGKELIARGIHAASSRWDGPFVAINCGAIPESLLESELFGYEDGAFTGAKKGGSLGKFELANQGTLFLDEIGDMSLGLQVKILRVLQEGTFVKIGGNKETKVNVRVIAATHRNLEGMVRNNLFRQDLYFRLNVIPLFVPPLRQRKEDIEPLLTYFLDYYNTKLDKNVRGFTPAVIQRLLEYHWPGNVRELQNAVEYAMNMTATDRITLECLPLFDSSLSYSEISELVPIDDAVESLFIKAFNTFGRSETGILKVAETLGVSRATVYRKMKKYGI